MVPTIKLDFVLHGNVKAENCRARLEREKHRALLCNVSGTAGSVDCECRVAAPPDLARHIGQGPKAAARAGAARRSISETLNTFRDDLAVPVHARHHDDAAVPPIIGSGENPAM